jgi:bifunctional oligoribonuclease and PAP phosphatase NrnA
MQAISNLLPLLSAPKKITITTHLNPDADALGSSLALYHYLNTLGHKVTVISSTPFPDNLAWMPDANNIMIWQQNGLNHDVEKTLNDSEILFCLDFNIHTRTKDLSQLLQQYNGIKVLIDHHEEPDVAYFNYGISMPSKSSTAEMIYDFIVLNKDVEKINKKIGDCIYAGVLTDTGGFRYRGTSGDTHRMVAHLLDVGVVPNEISELIYDTAPRKRLQILGHLLNNRLNYVADYPVAYMYLSDADMQAYNIMQGDTEGFVNYPLGVMGIKMAAFFSEKEGEIRMSFRSKGTVDVNEFARIYFNGGGHKNAAGGKSNLSIQLTIEKFLTSLQAWNKVI